MNATDIIRDYHSSALLLPSGKVITASGESRRYVAPTCPRPSQRNDEVDYRVFAPTYLHCGLPRPVVNGPAPGAAWLWPLGSQQEVTYQSLPAGTSIASVVLARAGSVTHHCDPNQRVANLSFTHVLPVEGGPPVVPPRVSVTVLSNGNLLPEGYYMLFSVTNLGTPSEAAWVQIQ